jgi:hypothetical protein
MSSRSLAAARAKRAGENAPPVSGNRPGTSIGSHAAFVPQQPLNVRVSRQPQMQPQYNQQVQQQPQQQPGTLPFSKLSISDAIGLITLRLGRIEQWVIENENDSDNNEDKNQQNRLSENFNSIDSSILTSIVNRLESIEKKENGTINNENITNLLEDVNKLSQQITKSDNEISKYNLILNKHTEQLFKFERELIETKDILKTFMMKYDIFTQETNDKFADYECAISDLEKNIQPSEDIINESITENKSSDIEDNDNNDDDNNNNNNNFIMSVDLKKIIKQELSEKI